jgi:hypothetical protein
MPVSMQGRASQSRASHGAKRGKASDIGQSTSITDRLARDHLGPTRRRQPQDVGQLDRRHIASMLARAHTLGTS